MKNEWWGIFSKIVGEIFLEEVENECNAYDLKMNAFKRTIEAERRMKDFVKFLYSEYLKKG